MATFILVHGAWHGGWCWERVVPILQANGHKALAPDLAGMGQDSTPLESVSLGRWADDIAALAVAQGEPVILVGHSRGGIVISEVAERHPEAVALLVYLTAFLLPSGETLLSGAEKAGYKIDRAGMEIHPNRTTTLTGDKVGSKYYGMVEQSWRDRAISQLCPEPGRVATTPLHLTPERFGSVRRAYIECARDAALPVDVQRNMHRGLPCDTVITMEADHSPFYSAPDELASALMSLV